MTEPFVVIDKNILLGRWSLCQKKVWQKMSLLNGVFLLLHAPSDKRSFIAVAEDAAKIASLIDSIKELNFENKNIIIKAFGKDKLINDASVLFKAKGYELNSAKICTSFPVELYIQGDDGRIRVESNKIATLQNVARNERDLNRKKKILIVDDSATIRKVLRAIFDLDSRLEVVAECGDPLEAQEIISRINPDVISLDINMPGLSGIELVKLILAKRHIPIIMVTALSPDEGDHVLQALAAGAIDYIQKPAMQEIKNKASDICQRFFAASEAKVRIVKQGMIKHFVPRNSLNRNRYIIAIGASTGGTEAIRELLLGLPRNIPPIVIVQHIPSGFSAAFAKRLADSLEFEVLEGKDGDEVKSDRVIIAPGGKQMRLQRLGEKIVIKLSDDESENGHKPSVDIMFNSAAEILREKVIGVILTGMGKDGALGLLAMKKNGARTVGQNESSCVVYGMPKAAFMIDAVEKQLPIEEIANYLMQLYS